MLNQAKLVDFFRASLIILFVSLIIDPFDWLLAAVSLIGIYISTLPFFIFIRTRDTQHIAFFLPLFMTSLYFLFPFLQAELVNHSYRVFPVEYIFEICFFSSLSVIAMFFGFYLPRFSYVKPIFMKSQKLSHKNLKFLFYFFLFFAIFQTNLEVYAHWLYKPFGEILQIFEFSQVLALSIGVVYFIRGGKSYGVFFVFIIFFFSELFFRVSDTLFSKVLYLFICIFFTYIIETRVLPWKRILLVLVLIIPSFSMRKEYRNIVIDRWYFGAEKLSISQSVQEGFGFFVVPLMNFKFSTLTDALIYQQNRRFENISYLGQCVHVVKNNGKDLKLGETFWWFPLATVPRVIFPWKPINNHATALAEEYGTKGLSKGAMNFPMLVEYYINFSFWGMVILSFFQGFFTRWILAKSAYGLGDFNLLVFINLLWHLMKVESNVAMIFGGFLQVIITWWVLYNIYGLFSNGRNNMSSLELQVN